MIEYMVVVLILAGIVFLAYRYSMLERKLAEIESALYQTKPVEAEDLEESVRQLIEELKSVADNACQEVTNKIEDLKKAQRELEDKAANPRYRQGGRRVLAVELVTKLADAGLSPVEIARQTGIGQAEVELTLRLHRNKRRASTTLRHLRDQRQNPGKEIAIA